MPRLLREFLRRQARIVKTGEITFAQVAILHLLKDKISCTMTEIARFLSVTTSAATGIVDRMVKSGFLARLPDINDRRVINIRLTPKGKRAIYTIFRQRQKMMIDIFKHFTSKEREIYLNTIKRMYAILMKGSK
jgi:DNA-binding MarR family transcriptional regulator